MGYRIREVHRKFFVEKYVTTSYNRSWFRTPIEKKEWVTLDIFGYTDYKDYECMDLNRPPPYEFDSLKEAKKYIKLVEKGTVYHKI